VPNLQKKQVPDAGHMLHHDQPQVLADMLEAFLQA
jgi:pimeloyl-ACP methyl ester carboxylesterase